MSPRQRREVVGWWGLSLLMAGVDTILAVYFIRTPTAVFRMSPVWDGILGVAGDLRLVGWLFATVALTSAVGLATSHWVLRFAFILALAPWGAMIGSFVYAAWTLAGLGTLTATLSAVALILHLASVGHFPTGQIPTRR